MANLKFYLYNKKEPVTNIYLRVSYGAYEVVKGKKRYLPFQYYIDETIEPKYWNEKQGRAKKDRRLKDYEEFNTRLQYIEETTFSLLRKLQNDGVKINNDILKKELDKIFSTEVELKEEKEFIDFFIYFIETANHVYNTTKTYKQTLKDLKEYEIYKGIKLTFDRVDVDFHNNFIRFLQDKRKLSPNTIGQRIKIIKTVLRASHDRGLHNNTDYLKKSFNKPREQTISIYLNEKELSSIYKLDLSRNETLDKVRDWFLIGAYTGLRFSDLKKLSSTNIQDNTILIKTQKTGEIVIIPLHTIVRDIFRKYNNQLPHLMSNQKFNDYIKEVSRLADINEAITIEETKGKLKLSKVEHKYNLVTAHTARRSFATNAYNAGIPSIQIMKMTGHKTEKSFLQYIKISKEENAKKLQLHPFFTSMVINK